MVNYIALVQFLIEPLLESKTDLRIDCESCLNRTWIRVAFSPQDKGRVFGKGGRTIQAVRQMVVTAAKLSDHLLEHRASIEIYDPEPEQNSGQHSSQSFESNYESVDPPAERPTRHITHPVTKLADRDRSESSKQESSKQEFLSQETLSQEATKAPNGTESEPESTEPDRKPDKPNKSIKLKS